MSRPDAPGRRPAPTRRRTPGIPDGYIRVQSRAGTWIVRSASALAVERGEADHLLVGPGARDKRPGTGRGGLALFDLGGLPVVGKRALHGGLAASLLGGLYLGAGRALAQIEVARRLEQAGVPAPEITAVGWRPALLLFRALAIVTRAIPGARNLYEVAQAGPAWPLRHAILKKTAELIRRMHDAGFLHADLNVTNLVLGDDRPGDRLHVVDLDRGRFVRSITESQRCRNLARLRRSYEKWIAGRRPLSRREEILFLRSYCRSDRELLRRLLGAAPPRRSEVRRSGPAQQS